MAINIEFREIAVGPAVNFRQNINYNFSIIKNQFAEVGSQLDRLNQQIQDFKGGIDIKVQSAQPTGQKAGDFWYRIL